MDSIIVDDNSSQFTYGGSPWAEVTASNFYGGSSTFPAGAQDGSSGFVGYGTLSFVFEGTAVAFFGNTPAPNDSQWVMVSIDGGTAGNTSYMDPSPPSTRQWYQSPTLPDAKHTIDITHIAATSVDYAVVTVGPQTNLAGVTLIVDDSSPDITYAGSWTRSNSFTSNGGPPIGLPYGNATHRTSSNGASATFSFTGTGVSVGGIFTWNIIGAFSVKYTLDGVSSTQDYTVTSSAQQFVNGERQQPNFIFFSRNSLSPGQHTLQMQLVNSVNQVFELDYITYTPSFNALASTPPNTNPSTTSPSTTSPSIPNTSTANPSTINASTTNTSTTNTSTAGASTTSASTSRSTIISPGRLSSQTTTTSTSTTAAGALVNASTSKSIPVGAIAGAVAGGVICLLLLLLLLCRKRRSNHRTSGPFRETMASFGNPGPLALRPFTTLSPSGAGDLHANESSADTPVSQERGLYTTLSPVMPGTIEFSPLTAMENSGLYGRMDRLQALFHDLQREVAATGGKGGDNARAAELRGRIAEIMRVESTAGSTSGGDGSMRGSMSEIETHPPPAYEQA